MKKLNVNAQGSSLNRNELKKVLGEEITKIKFTSPAYEKELSKVFAPNTLWKPNYIQRLYINYNINNNP